MDNYNNISKLSLEELLKLTIVEDLDLNENIRTCLLTETFNKQYKFDKGLDSKLKPLNKWFKKDVINWMSEWDEPSLTGELLMGSIDLYYHNRKTDNYIKVKEEYKFYTDTPLSYKDRLFKWSVLLYACASPGFRESNFDSILYQATVNLEWISLHPNRINLLDRINLFKDNPDTTTSFLWHHPINK